MNRLWAYLKKDLEQSFRESEPASPAREAFYTTIASQCIMAIISSMILDGGQLEQMSFVATVAFWPTVILIRLRRSVLTKGDILFVKWGYLWIWFGNPFVCVAVWHLQGKL